MIDDFRGKINKRQLQQEDEQGKIITKKRGRPRKPNNEHLHLMMDGLLKKRFSAFAEKYSKDMSSIVSDLVRGFLKEAGE